MWILGSFQKEAAFLYLPGLLSLIIAIAFPDLGETSILYGLLATALIDSGHVYTTAWRTLLYKEERKSSSVYIIFPVVFFLFFFFWFTSGLRGLWSFVVYSTLFHHVRQVYGFSKWYQALNRRADRTSDFFLYALALIPIISYHFRPGAISNYYTAQDLLSYPNLNILKAFILFYSLLLSAWIIYELRLWKSGVKEINRILSVGFPALIYGYCFFLGKTFSQVLFPLLFIHGVAYCGIMGQTLHRTQSRRFSTPLFAIMVVAGTAVLFGLTESWMEGNIIRISDRSVVSGIIVGLWLTPLYCHYLFDSIIWKRSHRESNAVVGNFH